MRSHPRGDGVRSPARTVVVGVLGLALLTVEIVAGRHDIARAFSALGSARIGWIIAAFAATLVSMQCFARAQRRLLRTVAEQTLRPGLSLRRVVRLTYSANALSTTMPAGGAVSGLYFLRQARAWGVSYPAAGFALVASGLLSTLTFGALLATFALASGQAGAATAAAVVAVLALAVAFCGHRFFGLRLPTVIAALVARLGALLGRVSRSAAVALESASVELSAIKPRLRDWVATTWFAACNWLADLAALLAACHAVPGGAHIGVLPVMAAYVAGMSVSSVAFLPGGLGVVEVAMIVTLHAGGVPTAQATAIVLLYRLVSCLFVVAVGWLALGAAGATRLRLARTIASPEACRSLG